MTLDGIDVWVTSLDATARATGDDWSLLSADEHDRANRFSFAELRLRYVTGRAWLRRVLAEYVQQPADRVVFEYGAHGRPSLPKGTGPGFNLAHSDHMAVLAVSQHELIGTDIEAIRPGFADENIAEEFFAPNEVAYLRSLPQSQQEQAFFECWTRKESFLKALGGGLSIALDRFEVDFGPDRDPCLNSCDLDVADWDKWGIIDLSAATPGHVTALATGPGRHAVTIRSDAEQEGRGG